MKYSVLEKGESDGVEVGVVKLFLDPRSGWYDAKFAKAEP